MLFPEAGGKDLKRSQIYPGMLGLHVSKLVESQQVMFPMMPSDSGLIFEDTPSDSEDSGLEGLL